MNKYINKLLIILAIINLICGMEHIIFEFFLLKVDVPTYKQFLLVENLLIAFIFVYFAVGIIFTNISKKQDVIKINMYFWIVFLLVVFVFNPKNTCLDTIKNSLVMPQQYYLLILGTVSFILSLISYNCLKRIKKI